MADVSQVDLVPTMAFPASPEGVALAWLPAYTTAGTEATDPWEEPTTTTTTTTTTSTDGWDG